MKKILVIFAALMLFGLQTHALNMGIVTGSTKGTYYRIGKDIASLLTHSRNNINLRVIPSNGSLDNVADVYETAGVQLGIVQSDVLSFIHSTAAADPKLDRIARKIRMVFPLYNEEIHLLANININSLADLDGMNVAIGKDGSGTYLTSKLLFEITGVQPKAVMIGGAAALEQLKAGNVAAMFYVAGYPVKLFNEFEGEKFHLVPIKDKSVLEYYETSSIPARTYPWQEGSVDTAAVKAVLITYNYRMRSCRNVGLLSKVVYDNIDWLRRNGHTKWHSVDLDYPLKKWEQYKCTQDALRGSSVTTAPASAPQPEQRREGARSTLDRILGNTFK